MHHRRGSLFSIALIALAGCTVGEYSSDLAGASPTTGNRQPIPDEPLAPQLSAATPAADIAPEPSSTAPAFVLEAKTAGQPQASQDRIFRLPPQTTARVETLISPAVLSTSENGVFIEDGRFFVAGGEGIYEIVGGPESFSAVLFAPNPGCGFGGITAKGNRLYAPCTRLDTFTADLIVFDPAREKALVGRAPISTQAFGHFNGTAFGPDGALYLSNSLAVDSPDPAVVRLEIVSEEPLVFEQTAVVAATRTLSAPDDGGGSFPNGVRFHGDTMYLVRGPDLVAVPISTDGPQSKLDVVYEANAGTSPYIDDFDIGDERMWLCEFSSLRVFGRFGASRLVVTDLDGQREFELDLPVVPSSSIVAIDTKFGPASILITSYFDGGLYRVTFE